MSAVPLIEAVQRAGGAIALQGDRLRLSAAKPLPQALLEEVRLHKTDLIDHLQRARQSRLEQPAAAQPAVAATSPNETVAAWAEGVARLRRMPPPRNYPERPWQQLIVDAERFLGGWAAQAAALGWPTWELFGCHCRAPWGRIQGMGLVLLLRGKELAALTATEAVIRTQTGARQTYYRQPRDPLDPAERCLAWELS
ncbi:MAG: hypothetical protein K0S81_2298 [Rhodospirillales bacterium]|jgi:hypothetical protein|nr:hypothetical protein [Geminicoccaceae bacterium]MDF2765304.1 hypothetical protein [Rhodospirillales bacterium]